MQPLISYALFFHSKLVEWYWPLVAFISPWIAWPFIKYSETQINITHYTYVYIVVILWVILYFSYIFNNLNLCNITRFIRYNPHLTAAASFAIWTLVATALSPQPIVSLFGNLTTYRDAAVYFLPLSAMAILVKHYSLRDPLLLGRIYKAIIATGTLFAIAGVSEILLGKGFFYNTGGQFATVLFTGPGHLAGFLALTAGIASGLFGYWRWIPTALLALGIGVTTNRTSIGAAIVAIISNMYFSLRTKLALVGVFIIFVVLGWGLYQTKTASFRHDIITTNTLETRLVFWRIALDGVVARPLTGWGGGQYIYYMYNIANSNDLAYLLYEKSGIVKSILFSKDNLFIYETYSEARGARRVVDWSPHNLFLDLSLSWGIIGLILYITILFYTIPPAWSGNPASLGILAYHLFLLLWPPSVQATEVLWILFGSVLISKNNKH